MEQVDVVLFNPPFFRFWGSHNDRAPVTLCYLSRFLEQNGISHVIYNGDYTGAATYWSMRWMFQNFETFKDGVDNKGSLYGEALEILMSFNPKVVVILGGEPLFPTKDWGNPFIAANFAKRLKAFGVHTVGIGPFFTLDKARFDDCFDCVLDGEPNDEIVEIVRRKTTGRVAAKPMSLQTMPNLAALYPKEQKVDFVMTSFGCFYRCAFCLVQKLYRKIGQSSLRFVELDTVMQDLAQRPHEEAIYLTDLDFSMTPMERTEEFARRLGASGMKKTFTIESRVDTITEEMADLWVELGIERVKLGVEGGTDELMKSFAKGTSVNQAETAVRILKARGIKVVVYLVVGGKADPEEYERTRAFVKRLDPEFVAVNVWAYNFRTDYKYDTQFSPASLSHWDVGEEEFFKHLELQQTINPTVGRMLDV
jgi:anaerobic magnesium-protoporphyrin IX monomethyl ester cyclase